MLSKRLLVTATLIFFLLVILQAPLNITKASPAIIRVPQDKPTIQSAIDSAKSGDVIIVSEGTYSEHINITYKRSISIIGENRDTTIIDGMDERNPIIRVAVCTNVVIANLTIKRAGAPPYEENSALFLFSSSNSVITNVTVIDNDYAGMILRRSNYTLIENSLVSNNTYGLWIDEYSLNNTIVNNNFIENNVTCIILSPNRVFCNFWSDYDGKDMDGDGIGDTPYQGYGFQDEYPLIEMWKLEKTFQIEVHTVTIRSNATISAFNYSSREIHFNLTGPPELGFFCEIIIPKSFLYANVSASEIWIVKINGTKVNAEIQVEQQQTKISFNGHLSKVYVQIGISIAESLDPLIYVLIITATIAVIIVLFATIKKSSRKKISRDGAVSS